MDVNESTNTATATLTAWGATWTVTGSADPDGTDVDITLASGGQQSSFTVPADEFIANTTDGSSSSARLASLRIEGTGVHTDSTAGTVEAVSGAVAGVAGIVAGVSVWIPGGQGVAAVAGSVALIAGGIAGIAGAVNYFQSSTSATPPPKN